MARTPSPPLALVFAAAAAAAASTSLAGCAEDFTPASVLEDVRVLALLADPLEAGPGDEVAVRAVVHEDPADPVATERWSFCPLTTGAQGGFRCVVAACETVMGSAREATANPYALAEACVAAAGGTLPDGAAGVPAEVESVFRYRVTTAGGRTREAVLRLPLRTTPPAERNLPPILSGVTLDGVPASPGAVGGTVRAGESIAIAAEVDPASLQAYVDGAGRTLTETVVVSFFTTAGRFTEERGSAPLATTALEARELPAGAGEAAVWVVARDLRGGQAVAGPFVVAISAAAR